jgi:hypothetical protein
VDELFAHLIFKKVSGFMVAFDCGFLYLPKIAKRVLRGKLDHHTTPVAKNMKAQTATFSSESQLTVIALLHRLMQA